MQAQFVIPKIPGGCYLGGMAALNLPSPDGTGDWHLEQTFFRRRDRLSRSFISGRGCCTDTNWIFGLAEIYDCTDVLDSMGILYEAAPVYAASHGRAIVDMVLDAVIRCESAEFVVLDDWMPSYLSKMRVLELLKRARPYLKASELQAIHFWKSNQVWIEAD